MTPMLALLCFICFATGYLLGCIANIGLTVLEQRELKKLRRDLKKRR